MSTILFYESNRLSLWHSGAALTRARAPLGESDERDQATAPAASERDSLERRGQLFLCICTTSNRAAQSGTKKRIEMPGARHICGCLQGGAQQFKERLKRRDHRRRSKEGEDEKAVREQTKAAGATAAVCCLFTVSSLPRKSGSALCTRRRKDVHESD